MVIPEALMRRFEVEYLGADYNLSCLLRDTADSLHGALIDYLTSIDPAQVKAHSQRQIFQDIYGDRDERQRELAARRELAEVQIASEIGLRRRDHLLRQGDDPHPEPYGHPDLRDVGVDDERLVKASLFDRSQGSYGRGDTIFQLAPTLLTRANSVYWVNLVLQRLPEDVAIRVRLDPLMRASREGYLSPIFAMRAYGRPLDWDRLEGMKDGYSDAGRWYPDEGAQTEVAFTDFVWSRRGDEVQFACEEVPTLEASDQRGGRYLHSIYHPRTSEFVHADGAVRFYDPTSVELRAKEHVRDAGKLGRRVKVFRADGPIPRDEWCSLAATFFVWNDEVASYFRRAGTEVGPRAT